MITATSENPSSRDSNARDKFPVYLADGRWQPTRTGDYEQDCKHGRKLAQDIVWQMVRENPLYLSMVTRSIADSGRWEAVEIGLFSRLSAMLTAD